MIESGLSPARRMRHCPRGHPRAHWGRTKTQEMLPSLNIAKPKSLVEIVEQRLRDAIVNGELDFGESITEEGLCAAFGVSRTPLREALSRLEVQGLVTVVPKKGTFVFTPTSEDLDDLCDFRLMLEVNALRRCLMRDKERTLAKLSDLLRAMEEAQERDDRLAYARADSAFHGAFFEHCGSHYLVEAYQTALGRISAIQTHLSVPLAQEQKRSLREHKALIKAFATGDLPRLEAILDEHISRTKKSFAALTPAARDAGPARLA